MKRFKANSRGENLNAQKSAVLSIFIALALLTGFMFYRHYHQKAQTFPAEQNSMADTQQLIANHDYKAYQLRVASFVNDYITLKRYNQAEKDLNQVVSNVPPDKITSDTYRSYWYLYQQKGDVKNQKKYALLTAEKLTQEGSVDEAALFKQYAKGS